MIAEEFSEIAGIEFSLDREFECGGSEI